LKFVLGYVITAFSFAPNMITYKVVLLFHFIFV